MEGDWVSEKKLNSNTFRFLREWQKCPSEVKNEKELLSTLPLAHTISVQKWGWKAQQKWWESPAQHHITVVSEWVSSEGEISFPSLSHSLTPRITIIANGLGSQFGGKREVIKDTNGKSGGAKSFNLGFHPHPNEVWLSGEWVRGKVLRAESGQFRPQKRREKNFFSALDHHISPQLMVVSRVVKSGRLLTPIQLGVTPHRLLLTCWVRPGHPASSVFLTFSSLPSHHYILLYCKNYHPS